MTKERIRSESDALIYLTDCLLATVCDMAGKKSKGKWEYERHIEIAQTAVNSLRDFKIDVEIRTRASDVLFECNGSVKEWAQQYEPY